MAKKESEAAAAKATKAGAPDASAPDLVSAGIPNPGKQHERLLRLAEEGGIVTAADVDLAETFFYLRAAEICVSCRAPWPKDGRKCETCGGEESGKGHLHEPWRFRFISGGQKAQRASHDRLVESYRRAKKYKAKEKVPDRILMALLALAILSRNLRDACFAWQDGDRTMKVDTFSGQGDLATARRQLVSMLYPGAILGDRVGDGRPEASWQPMVNLVILAQTRVHGEPEEEDQGEG